MQVGVLSFWRKNSQAYAAPVGAALCRDRARSGRQTCIPDLTGKPRRPDGGRCAPDRDTRPLLQRSRRPAVMSPPTIRARTLE
ncbi:protein of unknown function [Pseudomonas inefficax]|uniref:Uncharacterized protein n=1 Tax=Pseudomonas inefficax TaxID=2078786 RepID=A0AAQ1P600_9PSED|nr:protein of unknown function [Pseudomonas inefficax]